MTEQSETEKLRKDLRIFALETTARIEVLRSLAIKGVLNRASYEADPFAWVQAFVRQAAEEVEREQAGDNEDAEIILRAARSFCHDTLEKILTEAPSPKAQ